MPVEGDALVCMPGQTTPELYFSTKFRSYFYHISGQGHVKCCKDQEGLGSPLTSCAP